MHESEEMEAVVLIFHLRPARRKARNVALLETLRLLHDLEPAALPGGPLSEQGGVFWVSLPVRSLSAASSRFTRLGYTTAVDLVQPVQSDHVAAGEAAGAAERMTRWRRRLYRLVRLYTEDPEALREMAPDRRTFLYMNAHGEIRPVQGYRGDGKALSRRGLPVCDARMLVNLVWRPERGVLLDPFAGVGGIVIEAVASGWSVVSCDADHALRHGLADLAMAHYVTDARKLPLDGETVQAIATEPPYDQIAAEMLGPALREMYRVLQPGGCIALLCAAWQADTLRGHALELGLRSYLDTPIDRKGTGVVALAWAKE